MAEHFTPEEAWDRGNSLDQARPLSISGDTPEFSLAELTPVQAAWLDLATSGGCEFDNFTDSLRADRESLKP